MKKLNVDCLIFIFYQADKKSLYSCILVNKEWCNLAIPILWKEHSCRERSKNKFFTTILSCLSTSSKRFLFDNEKNILLKSPLFNYISFCKFPEAEIINNILTIAVKKGINRGKLTFLEPEIYKNIKELQWKTSHPLPLFPGASTCFSQLCNLYIDINLVNSDVLYEMAQICKGLNELTIDNCYQDLPGLISLIDVQRNLKSVT